MENAFWYSIAATLCFCMSVEACKSAGLAPSDVKMGINIAGEACEILNLFLRDGTMDKICATAKEIAKHGRNGEAIFAARIAQEEADSMAAE